MSSYIYENRKLFSLLYKKSLITLLMRSFEILIPNGEVYDKNLSYLMSFFTYGYFGIIHQWIKYDFDETPEQVKAHIDGVIQPAAKKLIYPQKHLRPAMVQRCFLSLYRSPLPVMAVWEPFSVLLFFIRLHNHPCAEHPKHVQNPLPSRGYNLC